MIPLQNDPAGSTTASIVPIAIVTRLYIAMNIWCADTQSESTIGAELGLSYHGQTWFVHGGSADYFNIFNITEVK